MALSVDPFSMLLTLGKNEKAFSHIRMDVRKAAKSLGEKAIKSPKVNVKVLAAMVKAMGEDNFSLLLEGLPKRALKPICKRLDRYNEAFQKGAPEPDDIWLRERIMDLALKKEEPEAKPVKGAPAKKPARKAKPKTAVGAKRKAAKVGKRVAIHAKRKKK